jgi:hypothetical protein
LLELQGNEYTYISWQIAKQRALDIIETRDDAAKLFQSIEEELRNLQRDDVYDGILANLKILSRFVTIYNREPSPHNTDGNPQCEPQYELFHLPTQEEGLAVAEAYPPLRSDVSDFVLVRVENLII